MFSAVKPLLLAVSALVPTVAAGQSLQSLVTYTGADPQYCNQTPQQTTSTFTSSDQTVNVFFVLNGMNPAGGDVVRLNFYGPNTSGNFAVQWTWPSSTNTGYSTRCFSADVNSAKWLTPSGFGLWQIQVLVNGNVTGSPYTFQLSSASPIEPRGPNYTGSFDAVDCTHIYGWAEDQNSPATTISVDISIDGSIWATLAAGDSRSDLTSLGIGNHAWNEYTLPANLRDGNQHSVRVVYSGTTIDLPGSTKTFQNSCGATVSSSIRVGHVVTLPSNPNGTVYYVATFGLYPFATAASFNSWGFQFSDVTTANAAEAALPIQNIIIPAKIAGCSDPISQINGSCGSTPLTLTWVSGSIPPPNMASGQSYQVKWQVAGPAQIQSRLCYGNNSDPASMCQQSGRFWSSSGTNTSGTFSDTLTAPTTSSPQTIYAVVQAQANGQTVYTQPTVVIVVGNSPITLSGQTWAYTAEGYGDLEGSVVVLQREDLGSDNWRYTWYVVADSSHTPFWGIDAAILITLYKNDPSILVKRSTGQVQVLYDTILTPNTATILQNLSTAPWQPMSKPALSSAQIDKVLTILGFVPFGIGDASDVVSKVKSVLDVFQDASLTTVHSSPTFQSLLQQDNYNTVSLSIDQTVLNIRGVRFSVEVNQSGSEIPQFMLRFAQSGAGSLVGGGIVGFELRSYYDVPILTRWSATGIF